MELIGLERWQRWADEASDYTLLPYVKRFEGGVPLFWNRFWQEASPHACVLESGKGGRFTIAGLRPVSVIEGKGDSYRVRAWQREKCVEDGAAGEPAEAAAAPAYNGRWIVANEGEAAPLEAVRAWLRPWRAPKLRDALGEAAASLPDCAGGALGLWCYDVVRSLERLPATSADNVDLPDYIFQRYEELWIVDHREGVVYAIVHSRLTGAAHVPASPEAASISSSEDLAALHREAAARAGTMERQWGRWCEVADEVDAAAERERMNAAIRGDDMHIDVERLPDLATSMTKEGYMEAVRRIQRYIAQGDVFQVNLSLRQSRPVDVPPERLYEWLRVVNPSPYMGYFRTPGFALVSASPELLVKLEGDRMSTRPIAGTRRRGRTPEEDRAMEDELLSSEKERAEHVMLVDLERNDLGRVAAYGTVKVPELLTVERYSHVMHLVSQVEARLAPGKDAFDVIAAAFPGGTITGAPKIRTMEIIEELEPVRRGAYTGSLGWIDYAGDMEFNIIIRTMVIQDGVCHMQAGAGIVIDSDPGREYSESLNKAKALWKAVQYAESTRQPAT